jgi:methyltransferase-like protein
VHRTSGRLVSLHAYVPRLTPTPSERPVVSPLTRLQARAGGAVTNLYHRPVELDSLRRYLVLRLDGRHDRAALVDTLSDLADRGQLRLPQSETPPTGPALLALLESVVEDNLRALAGMALLIA